MQLTDGLAGVEEVIFHSVAFQSPAVSSWSQLSSSPVPSVNMDLDPMSCSCLTIHHNRMDFTLQLHSLLLSNWGETRILHEIAHPNLQRALETTPPSPPLPVLHLPPFFAKAPGNENLPGIGIFLDCSVGRRGQCIRQMLPIVSSSSLLLPLYLLAPPSSSRLLPDVTCKSSVF